MRRVLICGIAGQDGAYLARNLVDRGYDVFGTSRDAQMVSPANLVKVGVLDKVNVVSMAINDFRSVLQVINRVQPDEIYNLAGQSSVALSFEQPVETLDSLAVGTLNLLECIRFLNSKIRFYNATSGECFGDTGSVAADEDTPFHPRSPYAVAKCAAYWMVANYREAYGLYACSGILFNHESPLRAERFVSQKIIRAACRIAAGSNEKLQLGNIGVRRDWGWAPEYVDAMARMLQLDTPEDFVIATGETHPLELFVETAFDCLGLNWRMHTQISDELLRPTDLLISRANPNKAATLLNWRAETRMRDVVARMIRAYQESGVGCSSTMAANSHPSKVNEG